MWIDKVMYEEYIFHAKKTKYCLCIPVINEGNRFVSQLERAQKFNIHKLVDIIICDGGSVDGSTEHPLLKKLNVNTLLVKCDSGKLSAQLRMGYLWAMERGYEGVITIDGNGKDSIESVQLFIDKLDDKYDLVQGSRYIAGGEAINTPLSRHLAVRFIHSPLISLAAGYKFTDTTNGFRAYSRKYLLDERVQPFREIFDTYELLAYLSVKAPRLNMKIAEVPVRREYPLNEKVPTKISKFSGNLNLIKILIKNLLGAYNSNEKL